MPERRPIALLPDRVARKIAAGEVIDRPASVLRELLDNAVDAGSTEIKVSWISGGLTEIKVIDNGWGMRQEDLALCILPHATSKIRSPEDLDDLHTLGFRGEALPSIGACSRLEILSMAAETKQGYKLTMDSGTDPQIAEASANPGTSVTVQDLFYALPARRRFLKSPGAESRLLRSVLEEKALAFPGISFSLATDGQLKERWLAGDAEERFRQIYRKKIDVPKLFSFSKEGENWTIWGMASIPGYVRKDRKHLQVFVNKRKINEFAFLQAISYAYSTVLPGGFFPYVSLFLEVEPSLVDFNIHPAKKEARFRNHKDLHRGIVGALREQIALLDPYQKKPDPNLDLGLRESTQPLGQFSPEAEDYSSRRATAEQVPHSQAPASTSQGWEPPSMNPGSSQPHGETAPRAVPKEAFFPLRTSLAGQEEQAPPQTFTPPAGLRPSNSSQDEGWRFLGQVLKVFLLVEWEDKLMILDQHAAHERILFNQLKSTGHSQELLFPRELQLEEDRKASILQEKERWEGVGIRLTEGPEGIILTHVPQSCVMMEKDIAAFFEDPEEDWTEDLEATLFANLACKAAIKSGDFLDHHAAIDLIRQALGLLTARCPHGRPLWVTLDREELYKRFGRIL
jgi:DNA mismatch repair protein MutL